MNDLLRRRRSGRPPTIAEDSTEALPRLPTSPSAAAPRLLNRTSSFISESSFDDARSTIRSSTDDLLLARASGHHEELHQEPSLWHSLPLLFAIVPAIGGIAFKKGAVFLTDVALLVVTALYLNWCLITPWIWYHSAQNVKVLGVNNPAELIVEDDFGDSQGKLSPSRVDSNAKDVPKKSHVDIQRQQTLHRTTDAERELRLHELAALALCFAGPLLGALMLHAIRSQISHFGDELVSNLHLSLFVLGAELRPLRHLLKMVQIRTIHLQRVVREDPHSTEKADDGFLKALSDRVTELEISASDKADAKLPSPQPDVSQAVESLQKAQITLQNQVDALTRAIRRYEKRATAQSLQTEGRLHDLNSRLKDTLSIAAAAASYSQKPGIFQSVGRIVALPIEATWFAALHPLRTLNACTWKMLGLVGFVRPIKYRKATTRQSSASRPPRVPPSSNRSLKPF